MEQDKQRRRNGHFIGSLEKAMRLLEAFGPESPRMGLTELARQTGFDRSTVQRLTTTFHELGYLDKDPSTRRYSPSIRMSELANAYLWSDDLMRAAMPRLIDLRQKLGETINFARLAGTDIVYTARLPSARTSYDATIIGRRVPALNTSSGRAMLSRRRPEERAAGVEAWPLNRYTDVTLMDREQIRERVELAARQGYAIAQDELRMNELAVAVAVGRGEASGGAVQCSVSGTVWTPERLVAEIVPSLLDAANAIT
ncbi:IclR family transcriptional regulator [Aurantimonas sp. 22II-16-19i]|uniref:IclR family transcriptional regulator n=1 Tax=Aurantimonas sp. 22II-16-19i TaxID=1317114 RepID=UPI0009F7C99D|nr:IclR family transcriptional regulator [Aurantimonas sp. 22II-16-19i]ORE98522.1 IclR family transcriptional regulator [Aurantimonas sp. 22II-16-19i]